MPDRCDPKFLSAFLDDGLNRVERVGVRRHLEACREVLDGHGRVKRILQRWVSPPVRPGFWERTRRRIDERIV
jgi:hypothetical protein